MNYYKSQKRYKRNLKIVRCVGYFLCGIATFVLLCAVGSVEFADKLALGMH